MIEDAVGESRTGQARLMVVEVTVQIGEDTRRDVLQSYRLVIEGRTGDRHEDEDSVIDKEGSQDDEGRPVELPVFPSEVIDGCRGDHRVIGGIPHVEQLAEDMTGEDL